MKDSTKNAKNSLDRRSFMKSGLIAGGAAAIGAGLLTNATLAHAQRGSSRGPPNPGDAAILRFLAGR